MYTTKVAAMRSGLTVPVLRAWERRYGIVRPTRATSGYRLYDDVALERLRHMRMLVEDGWSPSAAAAALLDGTAPRIDSPAEAVDGGPSSLRRGGSTPIADEPLVARYVAAAAALDTVAMDHVLDEMVVQGSFERAAEEQLLPAMAAIGEAWADGRLDVAAEHAASSAVHRRLAAAFEAAGRPSRGPGAILIGMPPNARHELGALAFAIAVRRTGLPVIYFGPDLPEADWVAAAVRTRARAAVIGSVIESDIAGAAGAASAIRLAVPGILVAFGGQTAPDAAAETVFVAGTPPIVLPDGLTGAVGALRQSLGFR